RLVDLSAERQLLSRVPAADHDGAVAYDAQLVGKLGLRIAVNHGVLEVRAARSELTQVLLHLVPHLVYLREQCLHRYRISHLFDELDGRLARLRSLEIREVGLRLLLRRTVNQERAIGASEHQTGTAGGGRTYPAP